MGLGGRILAFAIVAFVAAPRPATAAAPPILHWASSITTGLAEAKAKNLPFMVALNMDKERGNEDMVARVYRDPAVLAAAAKCICAIGSLSSHTEAPDPALKRTVCTKFGSVTCAEHQAIERVIRGDWVKRKAGEDINSPQHFFLAPDGRRLFQRTWTMEAKELAGLMTRAGELCAPATLAAWDTLEGRIARSGDPMKAVREEAFRGLADMKDPAVDKRLIDGARKPGNDEIAREVLDAFGAAMSPSRLALVVPFLDAKDVWTRMHAVTAVEAAKSPEALKVLGTALGRERDSVVRGVIYRAVAGCSPGDATARSLVMSGLKEHGPEVLPHAIVALVPWAEEPAVIDALKSIAGSKEDAAARAAACWTLGYCNHRDVAEFLKEVKDGGGRRSSVLEVARMAAQRLTIGVDDRDYRRLLKGFAASVVRHPGDPDE